MRRRPALTERPDLPEQQDSGDQLLGPLGTHQDQVIVAKDRPPVHEVFFTTVPL